MIKEDAITLYKDTVPAEGVNANEFMVQCWVIAVAAELKRKGHIGFTVDKKELL